MLAAALLTVVSFPVLFGGTVIGFLASAALVMTVTLPSPRPTQPRGIWDRTTRGIRIYLATPRLRGLLALNLAVAAAGAMVIVNTVVLVQARLGLGEEQVALALAAFGGGSMVAALLLPRLLDCILKQTYSNLDVLVSVDGPDPASVDACRPFLGDARVRMEVQPARLGWAGNTERTIRCTSKNLHKDVSTGLCWFVLISA